MRFARSGGVALADLLAGAVGVRAATTVTIATVSAGDRSELQKLSPYVETDTGIKLDRVVGSA